MERNYLKKQQKALALLLTSLIMMLMISLMFTSVASANVNEITVAGYINITADEAKQMMDKYQSIVILDVRTLAEYKSGHIDGSKLMPLLELEERINAIDGNSAVIVYCRSGIKSEKASKILLDHGFDKVYNVKGGLNAWQDARFPVVSGSTANHIFPSNDSLSSEIDDILNSGKPVFLFLYVDWCHFCQQQIPIIDELEQEYNGKITFFRVNCEEHPNAMKEFGASGYPSMFLIIGKGDDGQYEFQDFRGFTDKETLEWSIDYIITNGRANEDSGGYSDEKYDLGLLSASESCDPPHPGPCTTCWSELWKECMKESAPWACYTEAIACFGSCTACGCGCAPACVLCVGSCVVSVVGCGVVVSACAIDATRDDRPRITDYHGDVKVCAIIS